MLKYKNFTFSDKEEFISYIEDRMINYWLNHNNSFSNVCEALDLYDGFLGDNRVCPMDELDELLEGYKPSEIIRMVDDDFNSSDNYFYYDGCGHICSIDEKEYYLDFNYSDVFDELVDNYNNIFSHSYGSTYYKLFNDVDNINSQDENEIQSRLKESYYDYLFVDDDDFFSDDDLDN